eukprot:765683-Hanusia_phi.AAC.4
MSKTDGDDDDKDAVRRWIALILSKRACGSFPYEEDYKWPHSFLIATNMYRAGGKRRQHRYGEALVDRHRHGTPGLNLLS